MFAPLFLLFTIVPAVELALLIEVGGNIGAANTILIIILTGVLGAYMARLQGFIILSKIQNNLKQGIMPNSELMDGLMVLVGGIVLLTPGFITDALGFVLLFPLTRSIIKKLFKSRFEGMIQKKQGVQFNSFEKKDTHYDDIDIN